MDNKEVNQEVINLLLKMIHENSVETRINSELLVEMQKEVSAHILGKPLDLVQASIDQTRHELKNEIVLKPLRSMHASIKENLSYLGSLGDED